MAGAVSNPLVTSLEYSRKLYPPPVHATLDVRRNQAGQVAYWDLRDRSFARSA